MAFCPTAFDCAMSEPNPPTRERREVRYDLRPQPSRSQGPPEVIPAPMQAQSPAAGPQQQQAPFGAAPATGPTPNKGFEAAAAQRLGLVIKQLEELIPMAGATSDIGKACLDALNKLVKYVPAGSVNPAQQKNQIESMAMKNAQQNQQMQALKQQRMQGEQGGAQQPGAQAA